MLHLEAPGRFFSGLLGIPLAGWLRLTAGALRTLPEQPDAWMLVCTVEGRVRATWEDGSWLLEAGQCAAFPPGISLGLLPLEDSMAGFALLQGSAADAVLQDCARQGGLFFPQGGEALERMLRLLEAVQRRQPTAREVSEQAYQLLMRLYGTGKSEPEGSRSLPWVVEAALGILRREFAFLEGIGELADRLEVSQEYLTRVFRASIGMTPGKYLTQVRLEHAKLLLRQGEHSVTFVSGACGFSNGNYFARVFRENTGMSPREYALSDAALPPDRDLLDDSLYVL